MTDKTHPLVLEALADGRYWSRKQYRQHARDVSALKLALEEPAALIARHDDDVKLALRDLKRARRGRRENFAKVNTLNAAQHRSRSRRSSRLWSEAEQRRNEGKWDKAATALAQADEVSKSIPPLAGKERRKQTRLFRQQEAAAKTRLETALGAAIWDRRVSCEGVDEASDILAQLIAARIAKLEADAYRIAIGIDPASASARRERVEELRSGMELELLEALGMPVPEGHPQYPEVHQRWLDELWGR